MQRRSGRRGTLTHESHSLPKSDAKVPPLSVSHCPKSGARWIWEAPDPAVQVDGPSLGKKDQDPSLRYVFEAGFRLRFTSQSSSIRQGRPQCSIHNTARNTRMQPKTCPSTTSLQKGIDTFPDRANPTRWRLATLAGGVECQGLWGGCGSVMPAPDSRKRSPTGRLRCRPVLPCGVSTPTTGHLESLKSAADPTDWPSSPTPPEPSVSPTFRRVQSHPSVPRTKSPEPSRWPMTKIRGRLCRSSTPRFCRRQSILPLYGQSCSFRHQAMSSLVLDCGGLADGSCRIPTSTKTTLTLLLEEV